MGSLKEVQFSGCLGHHGSYSFYKYVKINGRILALSSFFPVRIFPDSAIFSIAEVQLLWSDRAENFVSLRLYFLPENTPEGRLRHHGEDEVIALQDKVIIRASDLSSWLVEESEWDWGYVLPSSGPIKTDDVPVETTTTTKSNNPTGKGLAESNHKRALQRDKFLKNEKIRDSFENAAGSSRVLVVNYQRYVRVRTLVKRLEGSSKISNWLSDPLVLALGGLNVGPDCRLLFSKEVFDYPELEDHELLCNHLAPKLKGRPRKRTRKRDFSGESESNNSTSSVASACSEARKKSLNGGVTINPNAVELQKQQVACESPKSVTSEEIPSPDSPPEKLPIGSDENEAQLSNEHCDTMPLLNVIKPKLEVLPAVEVNSNVESPKNGKIPFHQPKKRRGSRVVVQKSTPIESVPATEESEIKLESTTIRVTTPPIQDRVVPSPPTETSIPNCVKDPEPVRMNPPTTPPQPLEPSIAQLAEKLEKTNAIQIVPIRPSVITKQASPTDTVFNSHFLESPTKMLRTEDSVPNIPSVKEVRVSDGKTNYSRIGPVGSSGGTIHIERMGPLGESDKTTTLTMTGPHKYFSVPCSSKANLGNSEIPSAHQNLRPAHIGCLSTSSSYTKCNSQGASHKPALSITTIETEAKKQKFFPMSWGSPSQFLPTTKIYGDPSLKPLLPSSKQLTTLPPKVNAVIPAVRSNGVSITQAHSEVALDYSVKRQKLTVNSYTPAESPVSIVHNGTNGDCLDLRVDKVQPLPNNRKSFHTISDIPPPNAVNQLGLRLTSEVTLFPSHHKHQKQCKRQSPQVHVKRSNNRDQTTPILYNNHQQFPSPEYEPVQAQPRANAFGNSASRHSHLPSLSSKRASECQQHQTDPLFPRSSISIGANPYSQTSESSSVWKTIANASPVMQTAAIPTLPNNHHAKSPASRTNNTRELTALSHSSPNSTQTKYTTISHTNYSPSDKRSQPSIHLSKTSPTTPLHLLDQERRFRHPSENNTRGRERSSRNSEQVQINSPYGNFALPAPQPPFNYPYPHTLDPSYFETPFPVPYGIPPSLLRFPPGSVESLQLAYLQQGFSPHAHMLWPAPGRESRNGTQK